MTAPRITAERIAELKSHYPRDAYSQNRKHHPFGHIAYSTIDIHELIDALESAYAERDELAAQVERFKTGAVRVSLDGKVYFEPYVQLLKEEIDKLRAELDRLSAQGGEVPDILQCDWACSDSLRPVWEDGWRKAIASRPTHPDTVEVPAKYLEALESAANRFCSSCRDNNASCSMTARHFGGTGCGAWKLDGARINALHAQAQPATEREGTP